MDKKVIQEFVENVFFSKEAADYLGISSQRLNQLVHSGQIKPIKKTPAGALFLKSDLDERLNSVKNIASEITKSKSSEAIDLESPFMHEVMNYYTLQSLNNYSDKKTEPIFLNLSSKVCMESDMRFISKDLSQLLKIEESKLLKNYGSVYKGFERLNKNDYIIKKGMKEYPELLAMTEEAPPYLFLRGNVSLLKENIVSVVGSRMASKEGIEKAYRLSRCLGKAGIVVASGLARGIDTAAHKASLDNNYMTISVIGTPITKVYPKENEELQKRISEAGLVVSQFPPSSPVQRWHFPMRNAVMSGISLATAIVEAGETSGALKQADYALKQNRLVFIPQSALENENISWPKKYIKRKGAVKFSKIEELLKMLELAEIIPSKIAQASLFSEGADTVYVHKFK
jgi:DNA processing protein